MFIFRNGDIANIKLASDNIRDNFVFKFMKNCYASLNIIYLRITLWLYSFDSIYNLTLFFFW